MLVRTFRARVFFRYLSINCLLLLGINYFKADLFTASVILFYIKQFNLPVMNLNNKFQ